MLRRPRCATIFPYATLFRSVARLVIVPGPLSVALFKASAVWLLSKFGVNVATVLVKNSRPAPPMRSQEHTTELQPRRELGCGPLFYKTREDTVEIVPPCLWR